MVAQSMCCFYVIVTGFLCLVKFVFVIHVKSCGVVFFLFAAYVATLTVINKRMLESVYFLYLFSYNSGNIY